MYLQRKPPTLLRPVRVGDPSKEVWEGRIWQIGRLPLRNRHPFVVVTVFTPWLCSQCSRLWNPMYLAARETGRGPMMWSKPWSTNTASKGFVLSLFRIIVMPHYKIIRNILLKYAPERSKTTVVATFLQRFQHCLSYYWVIRNGRPRITPLDCILE